MPLSAVVFDAYGTLLDVHAAMQRHADKLPPDWERISAEWRTKQLEYTWITTLTGPEKYRDFWALTQESLDVVSTKHGLADPALRAALLDTYYHLPAYPDAIPALTALRARGFKTAILSNGEPSMLAAAVDASGLHPLVDAVISVDTLRAYKPDPRVYTLAADRLGLPFTDMAFVSSNPWDAQAAARAGFHVFWCNPTAHPPEYDLAHTATTLTSLTELASAVLS